ncbi:Hsp33 family molecular chaperone HslO [Stomatobaculum longum]|uniref:Hsp33 family molecular chaperone HslO n=1 Tax=Stomatobaculum longum TaxID=796942 RepID=UPI00287FFE3D|nr:Hsp33 family molecular chaperone HslO [Stomatobaculum longum]
MSDYIVRAFAEGGMVRAFAATTGDLVEEARRIHSTSPIVTAALGRLMTAGLMMGAMMKDKQDLLTIKIDGDGPMRGMLVTANNAGEVKGYPYEPAVILPANQLGKLDVAGAVGKGTMTVISDLGLKEPYVGQVELVSGEIAEDIAYYYASSEQVPSGVGLGVLMNQDNTVRCAGGFIVQLMPGCPEEVITALEDRLKTVGSVTSFLKEGKTPEDILAWIFEGRELKLTDKLLCRFHCDCSRERVERALISLGSKELKSMAEEKKPAELHCQFCGKSYLFSPEELTALEREAH